METYIQQLEQLAQQNLAQGGSPYSAVVVIDGKVVATGVNEAHKTDDATQHAELLAIQRAIQKVGKETIKQAVIYASGEPCPMCTSAAQYVGIEQLYFVVSREEIEGMGKSAVLQASKKRQLQQQTIKELFEKWDV